MRNFKTYTTIMFIFLMSGFMAFGANFTDDILQFGKPGSTASKDITFGASNKKKLSHSPASGTLSYNDNNLSVGDGANTADKTIVLNKGASSTTIRHNFSTGALEIENAGVVSQKGNNLHLGDGTNTNKVLKFNKGASSPEIRYNATTAKLEFSNDAANYKAIGSGSGGGGGINLIATNPDFEANVTTDWVVSGATAVQSSYTVGTGDNTKYATVSATIVGGYYESAAYQVTDILNGQDCELNFNYQSTGSWRADVYSSGTVVASQTIVANTNWSAGPKIFYPCGVSATTPTKVRFTNLSLGVLAVDDVYLGAIRGLKNGAVVEPWQSFVPTGTFTTNTAYTGRYRRIGDSLEVFYYVNFVGPPNAVNMAVNLPSGFTIDTSKIVAADATIVGSVQVALTNYVGSQRATGVAYYLNTTSVGIRILNTATSNDLRVVSNTDPVTIANGDVITVRVLVPVVGLSGSNTTFDSRCPNDISCENVFSAKVSAAGVVTDENLDWLNGNPSVSGGQKTFTFNAGVFTTSPNCWSTVVTANGANYTSVGPANSANVTTRSHNTTNNVEQTSDFTLYCQKRGADFVVKRTVEGFLSKTVTSTGSFIERIERVKIAPTCTTSPCTIVSQSGGISSVTRSAQGVYSINFTAGVFSVAPTCTFQTYISGRATGGQNGRVADPCSTTSCEVTVMNLAASNQDGFFHAVCMGPR